jgi:16S rRNA (guanine527-N7)-methyltransferase
VSLEPRTAGRLTALTERYGLGTPARDALAAVLEHQADDETASTTIRDAGAALDRHVADALVALDVPAVGEARRIADLGSGAGWPGIALAAALPEARVSLVESSNRRCRYLDRLVAASGLRNVAVVHARAESWEGGRGAHDLVTARALAALPVVCEYAAPLLAEGGTLVAWKGAVEPAEAADGAVAAEALGLEQVEVRPVEPFPGARSHTLHVLRKVGPTPARFPRRPGMALKRPLGSRSTRAGT